ncbi:hypothetical protein FDJ43_gp29 [Microbacterium phage Koji]|uniref:SsDNA binding protein n=1 Tax=Microbacterium phage Koji TaxID=2099625 RepID=A0A2P1CFC1_9CAUD|nr:hypothetical protein FDJ43_gp29 [Microbacterium phage Koji]AVJ49927.1 hypothetical protein PBI_KOJI_29 [Microbacterium phage Koji]
MNITAPQFHIITHEHAGYFYIEANGTFFKGCRRCGGTGHYSFNGFDSICYACRNVQEYRLGDPFTSEAEAKKWCEAKARRAARREAKREQERLAKLAKRQAAWDALAAAHPDVWVLVSKAANVQVAEGGEYTYTERDSFVAKLADMLWSYGERQYTERQIAALQAIADKRSQQQATSTPAPAGRVQVTGTILSAKVRENDYGVQNKITVQDDRGFRVYVSIPKAQGEEAFDTFLEQIQADGSTIYDFGSSCWFLGTEDGRYTGVKGRRITFTATLEASQDDPSFAFGSRPTKGSWIN